MKISILKVNRSNILLSVWNKFFSYEQCAGFARNQLSIDWIGTGRPPREVNNCKIALISSLLLKLYFQTGFEFLLNYSRSAFNLTSMRYPVSSDIVWSYMEYNNGLLIKSKSLGIPTILDIPIGHQRTCQDILARELAKYHIEHIDTNLNRWTARYEKAYQLADYLVVGSMFVKHTLVERGIDSSKIHIIPYGVNVEFWDKAFDKKKFETNKIIFIYTASISLRKGIQYLLAAWEKANLQNAELWVCGSSMETNLGLFRKIPASVKVLGPQSHKSLRELYKRCHIYVLPSLFEGLARSGLEALASGLPCIVTKETGLTDFVINENNGWVVESANTSSLSDSIVNVYKNRANLYKFAENAFKTGQLNSWKTYGDRCSTLVKNVLVNLEKQKQQAR